MTSINRIVFRVRISVSWIRFTSLRPVLNVAQ